VRTVLLISRNAGNSALITKIRDCVITMNENMIIPNAQLSLSADKRQANGFFQLLHGARSSPDYGASAMRRQCRATICHKELLPSNSHVRPITTRVDLI